MIGNRKPSAVATLEGKFSQRRSDQVCLLRRRFIRWRKSAGGDMRVVTSCAAQVREYAYAKEERRALEP